jgi:hypothetical protein
MLNIISNLLNMFPLWTPAMLFSKFVAVIGSSPDNTASSAPADLLRVRYASCFLCAAKQARRFENGLGDSYRTAFESVQYRVDTAVVELVLQFSLRRGHCRHNGGAQRPRGS